MPFNSAIDLFVSGKSKKYKFQRFFELKKKINRPSFLSLKIPDFGKFLYTISI